MCGRLLGIDVGKVRVGVAMSDSLGITVSPLAVYQTAQGRAERSILDLISEYNVKKIVVGMPYSRSGEKTKQCEFVEHFITRLRRRVEIEIDVYDEYLSSEEAIDLMKERGFSVRDNPVDAFAAMIILEDYIRENPVKK